MLSTFRTLLKGFVFCGNAAIFWTYAIVSRTTHFSEKPWAQGPKGPGAMGPGPILGGSWASKYRACQQNQASWNNWNN